MARNELRCTFLTNASVMGDGSFLYVVEKLPNDIERHLNIFFNDSTNKVDVSYTVWMGKNKVFYNHTIKLNILCLELVSNGGYEGIDAIIYLDFISDDELKTRVAIELFYKSMDDAKKDLEIIKALLGEEK